MYPFTLAASLFAIATLAIPLSPRAPSDLVCTGRGDCYRIQSLSVVIPDSDAGGAGKVRLAFTLWDDSPSANNRTVCRASWDAGTAGWPQDYIKCEDDNFQWLFSKFDSITEWEMKAAHDFRFGNMGARSFHNGTATSIDFDCHTNAVGAYHCRLKDNHVINLQFYAMIA